jgi:metallo-beta-lactamase family protein
MGMTKEGYAMSTQVTFLGASRTVTGSKYLLETKDKKFLVDCGLFQGKKELRERNWKPFPVPPETISAVFLTHAHLDHCGYLPRLVKEGFSGPIYCTAPTRDLTKLILLDSGKLQEEEARYANSHGSSKHSPAMPLYDRKDAKQAIKQIEIIPPRKAFPVAEHISVTPYCAGHILGASILNIRAHGRLLTFSGDIGRYGVPIMPDPQAVPLGELLVCESTYGDRYHSETDPEEAFMKIILEGIEKDGPILIPSFAIGRTQHLLYLLAKLEREKKIPEIPVLVDSPMAVDATEIYKKYRNHFDEKAKTVHDDGFSILRTKKTAFLHSVQASKKLNSVSGPRIIIAGSGMVTGGRILHHFMHWLSSPKTTVLFVGYQAEGTRGDRLLKGEPSIRIFGQDVFSKASIKTLSGLSAHGDKAEMTRWLASCSGTPRIVKIVHGEKEVTQHFSDHLKETFKWNASPAEPDEVVTL